ESLHLHPGNAAVFVVRVKDVAENGLQRRGCGIVSVERNLVSMPETQGSHVIQAENVVSVCVGVKDGVNTPYPFAYSLLTKIRRCIDQHAVAVILQHHGRAGPLVVRVARRAHAAGAADGGYSHRCSAAQDREDGLHFCSGVALGGCSTARLAMALVNSIQAILNSNSTFWSMLSSLSVRLPFVLSCSMVSESMVCRAP